jgi:hypothetical protein
MILDNTEIESVSEEIFHISSDTQNAQLLSNNTQQLAKSAQILFIDSTVADYQTLIDNLTQPTDIVILDSRQDGILQITESLSKYDSLEAVHIVSHGNVGQLFLGSTILEQNTLTDYENLLASWDNYIEADGDILLYGCNVAANLVGEEFVKKLGEYTNADIIASDDRTGSNQFNGNWELEYQTGDIEADLIFGDQIKQEFPNILVGTGYGLNDYLDNYQFNNFVNYINSFNFDSSIDPQLAFGSNSLFYIDKNTLGININSPRFDINTDYKTTAPDNYKFNAFKYGFTTESFNFNYNTFNFSSVSTNSNTITFGFDSQLNLSQLTNSNYIKFGFLDANKLADGTFDYGKDKINLGNFSFDAKTVTFGFSSISFEYDPNSVNFNYNLFRNNSNLFEYKLLDNSNISFKNFNASDYRALDYAFKGDELFDFGYYQSQVKVPKGVNPFTHYIENGWKLKIDPNPLFDVDYYLNNNIDVLKSGVEPLKHFTTFGYQENHANRDPNALFDTSYYNANNPDVANAKVNPLLHYLEFGYAEGWESRDPNRFFDTSYYTAKNPDVAKAGVNPLQHYIEFGWKESRPDNPGGYNPNRDPNPFLDTEYYFSIHEDVRLASYTNPNANPVQHLLEFGTGGIYGNETRPTHPLDDVANQVAFTTLIDGNSEGFEFAQNEFAKLNIQLTPREQGGILVATPFLVAPLIVKGIEYAIYTGLTYLAADQLNIPEGTLDLYQAITESSSYESFSISVSDLFTGTPPFPDVIESTIEIETFPEGSVLENLLNLDGRFYTPLEPIDELLENVETFPQRDEILEGLLDGPFIFPSDVKIPIGFYTIGETFSATSKNIAVDLGTAREIKVADIVGGYKTVTPGRPKKDLTVYNKNSPRDGITVDVVGPNNELIMVGGANKAKDIELEQTKSIVLKRIADSYGVQAQAYYADNTPKELIDKIALILGANNVFIFTDVDTKTPEEISNLRDLDIITDRIDF